MDWPFDPTVYAGLLLLCLGYAALARGRSDGRRRALFFGAGALTIWAALETPLDGIGDGYLQSAHMFQHVLIGLVAPPLLLLSLSPAMAAVLLRLPGLRPATEPVPAQAAFAAVMLGWHLPALYNLTLASEPVHVFEHLTFIASGCLFWWPVVGATSAHAGWRLSEAGKVLYLLFGTVPADTVSVILMFSRAPFYPFYASAPRLVAGFDAESDQVMAGVVLMVVGKLSSLVAVLDIAARWLRRVRAEEAAEAAEAARALGLPS